MLGWGLSGVLGGLAGGWISCRCGFEAVFRGASGAAAPSWLALRRSRRFDRCAFAVTGATPA